MQLKGHQMELVLESSLIAILAQIITAIILKVMEQVHRQVIRALQLLELLEQSPQRQALQRAGL